MDRGQCRLLAGKLLVEVARIGAAADGGEVRRRDALVEDVVPTDVSEKWLSLDLGSILFTRSKSSLRISGQKLWEAVSDPLP